MAKTVHTAQRARAAHQQLQQAEAERAELLARVAQLRRQLAAVQALADLNEATGVVPVAELRATTAELGEGVA